MRLCLLVSLYSFSNDSGWPSGYSPVHRLVESVSKSANSVLDTEAISRLCRDLVDADRRKLIVYDVPCLFPCRLQNHKSRMTSIRATRPPTTPPMMGPLLDD